MIAVVAILGLLCLLLALRIYTLERDLRSGAKQLKERRQTGSGAPLRLAAPNSSAEALLAEVNLLLRQGEDDRSAFQSREKALREQIANISHDLRTPLTSILGYLQLMESDALSEEGRGHLAVVLGLLCLLLALRVYTLERDLRSGAKQLKERKLTGSGAPLRLAAPNSSAEALLAEINALLRQGEDDRSHFQGREKALREQIANISHDLRTPLTSILGYLQLMESDTLSEEGREHLAVVEERAKVLQELIATFYDLSRLEAGEYPVSRERVDLREVLSELLAAFYQDLEGKFQVTVDLPDRLPPVWGDRAALTRVYANLIRNALDHGNQTLSIAARETADGVETRFANGGSQVRQEDLPHVFDRFFTTDRTRSGGNTGLGLAIVKALALRMGGSARAEQTGDTFVITLTWKK